MELSSTVCCAQKQSVNVRIEEVISSTWTKYNCVYTPDSVTLSSADWQTTKDHCAELITVTFHEGQTPIFESRAENQMLLFSSLRSLEAQVGDFGMKWERICITNPLLDSSCYILRIPRLHLEGKGLEERGNREKKRKPTGDILKVRRLLQAVSA
ncbi:hypothetical protein RUND412_008943 [Rhizina undulata]